MSKRRTSIIFDKVRKANLTYNLVENGDSVAVGISGGKDSLTLLYFLKLLNIYTPLRFSIHPIYIDLGWETDIKQVETFCLSLELPLLIEKTNIGEVVFKARQEKNPCSLCANLRRGALNTVAKRINCNKVALGHHLDDVVNTMFLSMIYASQFNVFKPKTYLDRMDITVIRPLVYVEEKDIELFITGTGIEISENRCPAEGKTKRDEISLLLNDLETRYPGVKRRILKSIENVGPDTFWQ
ncbi:MAG: ATP-binding protein [Syntrophomonadaceae bacterium]|nr:ATP-binding protein [Syntrophomonadaceae bacterium]MDD4549265.1 ATP-binding protein [Syntrophomonadaceae bacterium]